METGLKVGAGVSQAGMGGGSLFTGLGHFKRYYMANVLYNCIVIFCNLNNEECVWDRSASVFSPLSETQANHNPEDNDEGGCKILHDV